MRSSATVSNCQLGKRAKLGLAVSLALTLLMLLHSKTFDYSYVKHALNGGNDAALPEGLARATPFRAPSPNAAQDCPTFPAEWKTFTYPLPTYFGLPSIPIVLESESGTCNYFEVKGFPRPNVCDLLSTKQHYEPDPHVREILSSLLWDCHFRKCYAIDVGANVGYFAAWMASLGAEVTAIEPQVVLHQALVRTAAVNCLNVNALNGYATSDDTKRGTTMPSRTGGWRMKGPPSDEDTTPVPLPMIPVYDHMKSRHVTLLKIDTDAVDGEMLDAALRGIESKEVTIESIVCEFTGGTPDHLRRFHVAGYEIYKLNVHDDRRHFDDHGNDVISHFQDIKLEPFLEEFKFLRNIKLLYHLKVKGDMEVYKIFTTPRKPFEGNGGTTQFLITKLDLTEPTRIHSMHVARPEGVGE
ncbi:hypothetical protein HDU90_006728 [Geranomyces variabilis]|nr:hypothetical protein HDU90_006728 [Geranomyces variabilis]